MMDLKYEAAVGISMRRNIERILSIATLLFGVALLLMPSVALLPVYAIISQTVWGILLTILGTVRTVILIINGYPEVRLILSFSTIISFWIPLVLSTVVYSLTCIASPTFILAFAFILFEGLSIYTLSALWEAKRVR